MGILGKLSEQLTELLHTISCLFLAHCLPATQTCSRHSDCYLDNFRVNPENGRLGEWEEPISQQYYKTPLPALECPSLDFYIRKKKNVHAGASGGS